MTGLTTSFVLQTLIMTTGAQPYSEAYKQLNDEGRPLLVLVAADWCPACKVMKSTTMAGLERRGKLRDIAFTIVNTERQSALARKIMRGGTIPQLVLYQKNENGYTRKQLTGGQSEGRVESFISAASESPSVTRTASSVGK